MRPHIPIIAALGLFVITPAGAQSLQDRINHVRQEQARQQDDQSEKHGVRHMLGTLLYTDVTVNFDESPAREVFEYLATRLDLTIIGRYADDKNADGYGIDPDKPITLNLEDAPALTVLELALEQASGYEEATWQFRRGFIEIGTKDRLSVPAARVVKVYPIDDLLYEPPDFTDAPSLDLRDLYRDQYLPYGVGRGTGGTINTGGSVFGPSGYQSRRDDKTAKAQELVDYIIDNVEPLAWEANGGEYASIRYLQGALVVRAPDYIHRQIGGYPPPIKPAAPAPPTKPTSSNP